MDSPIKSTFTTKMKTTKDSHTTETVSSNLNLTPMATNSERILQSTTSPLFQMVDESSKIETQKREPVETFEHASVING